MMTEVAASSTGAASSGEAAFTLVYSSEPPPPPSSSPKVAKSTLASERFMALHMMRVRISPDAPTSEPAMMSRLFSSTKPVAQAARPEYEFRSEMTTGMSAPPIGTTRPTPRTRATRTSTMCMVKMPAPASPVKPPT